MGLNQQLKKSILEAILTHDFPSVLVDTNYPGVEVPPNLKGAILFRLAFKSGPQIPDLKIGDEGWEATLSFGGSLSYVKVPWDACVEFCGDPQNNTFRVSFLHEPSKSEPKQEEGKLAEVKRLTPKFGVIKGEKT